MQFDLAIHERVRTHAGDLLGFTNEQDGGVLGARQTDVISDVIRSDKYMTYMTSPKVGDDVSFGDRRYDVKFSFNVDIGEIYNLCNLKTHIRLKTDFDSWGGFIIIKAFLT